MRTDATADAADVARALEDALPKPRSRRSKQVMTVWSEDEYTRLEAAAKARGQKVAAFIRDLVTAALVTLERR